MHYVGCAERLDAIADLASIKNTNRRPVFQVAISNPAGVWRRLVLSYGLDPRLYLHVPEYILFHEPLILDCCVTGLGG